MLGYGLFAAVLLAVAVLPLLVVYRAKAARLVDRAIGRPQSGVPSQDWLDMRGRLLAPLVTAVVAAFVPT